MADPADDIQEFMKPSVQQTGTPPELEGLHDFMGFDNPIQKPTGERAFNLNKQLEEEAKKNTDWETGMKPKLQDQYPGMDPEAVKFGYEQKRKLEEQRTKFSTAEEKTGDYLLRKMQARQRVQLTNDYREAAERYNKGEATDKDYADMAAYEKLQSIDSQRSLGGSIQDAALSIPEIAAQAYAGGKVLKGLSMVPKLGFLAPAATEAGAISAPLTLGRAAGATAGFAARTTAQTALMPSMYQEGAAQRALEAGGKPTDLKNAAPAFALGALNTAVLGSLSSVGNIPGEGVKYAAQRIAAKGAIGVVEQQASDIVASAVGLETGYGALGDLMKGNVGDALKHVTVQATTFAAFAALHGENPDPILHEYQAKLKEMAGRGVPRDVAGKMLRPAFEVVTKAYQDNPSATPDDIVKAVRAQIQDGPARDLAISLAKKMPESVAPKAQEQSAPNPDAQSAVMDRVKAEMGDDAAAKLQEHLKAAEQPTPEASAPQAEPAKPQPMTPDQAAAALQAEEANGPSRNRVATPEHPPVAEPDHLKDLPDQDLADMVKAIGLRPGKTRAANVEALMRKPQQPAIQPTTEPRPADPTWADHYKQLRSEGKTHEQAGGLADLRSDQGQEWQHTGTKFEGTDGNEFQARSGERYTIDDKVYPAGSDKGGEHGAVRLAARDASGKEAGVVVFDKQADGSYVADALLSTEAKGVARGMYDYLKDAGERIVPSKKQSADGKDFWKKNAENAALPKVDRPQRREADAPAKPAPEAQPLSRSEAAHADLEKLYEESKLTEQEKHVLRERLIGRSHADIAGDKEVSKIGGKKPTRQLIELREKSALAKLGSDQSIAKSVHDEMVADRKVDLIESGQHVPLEADREESERTVSKAKKRLDRQEKKNRELQRLADEWIKESESANPSPERLRSLEEEAKRRDRGDTPEREAESSQPPEVPRQRGRVGEAPIQRPADAGVQEGPAPAQAGDAGQDVAGATQGNDQGTPPAAERGEAADHVLIPEATKQRLADLVKGGKKHSAGELVDLLREKGVPEDDIQSALQEAGKYPRGVKMDEPALAAIPAEAAQQLVDSFKVGGKLTAAARASMGEKYGSAKIDAAIAEIRDQKGMAPEASSIAQGVHRQTAASMREDANRRQLESEMNSQKQTVEPAKDEGIDFDFGANTAAKTAFDSAVRFMTEETGALNLSRIGEVAKDVGDRLKRGWEYVSDGMNKFGGAQFPRMARLAQKASDAWARAVSAPGYARAASVDYIDSILGKDATPEQSKRIGETFVEERRREAVKNWDAERAVYMKAKAGAEAKGDMKEAAAYGKAAADLSNKAMGAEAKTMVGGKDRFLKSEADFQASLNSPEYKDVMRKYEHGGFKDVIESMFRKAQGMDETDPIDTRTQLAGRPFTLKAIEGDAEPTKAGGQMRGNLANPKLRKLQAAHEASFSAGEYETDMREIISHTLQTRASIAARADAVRELVESGHASWAKPGESVEGAERIPNVSPPKGTQEAKGGQTDLWVSKEKGINDEVRQALQVDKPFTLGVLTAAGNLISKGAPISTLEAAYHTKNNLTFLFKPGTSPVEFFKNVWNYAKGDKATMQRVVELARIGAWHEGHAATEGSSNWNPLKWTGKFLETVGGAMRLTADQAFDRLESQGRVEGDEGNRRDFINQLGNYNKASQARVVAFLRDVGAGPFATAGSNFYMQGIRALTGNPGVRASSWKQAVGLRAEQYARMAGVLAVTGLVNYFKWGRIDGDDDTPAGAIKVSSKDGKAQYLDLTNFTGLTRGARQTGLLAALEGARQGKTAGKTVDDSFRAQWLSALQPGFGPAPTFAHTAITGEELGGRRIAPQVSTATTAEGRAKAFLAGKPAPGSSQAWENFKAAIWHAIPLAPVASEAVGGPHPEHKNTTLGDEAQKLGGPFVPREHEVKRKKIGAR